MCPVPCSPWSSHCGIRLFLNFPCTFPCLFDGEQVHVIYDSRLNITNSFSVIWTILSFTEHSVKEPHMSLTLISLSASSIKVNGLNTSHHSTSPLLFSWQQIRLALKRTIPFCWMVDHLRLNRQCLQTNGEISWPFLSFPLPCGNCCFSVDLSNLTEIKWLIRRLLC